MGRSAARVRSGASSGPRARRRRLLTTDQVVCCAARAVCGRGALLLDRAHGNRLGCPTVAMDRRRLGRRAVAPRGWTGGRMADRGAILLLARYRGSGLDHRASGSDHAGGNRGGTQCRAPALHGRASRVRRSSAGIRLDPRRRGSIRQALACQLRRAEAHVLGSAERHA
jgi:hypothetical protein